MSSASSRLCSTPSATRNASVEHSARRCSNSRSIADEDSMSRLTTLPGWRTASSCILAPTLRRHGAAPGSHGGFERENALKAQLLEQRFEVRLIHDELGLRAGQILHLVEGPQQPHLGHRILFGPGHLPARFLAPFSDSVVAHKDAQGKNLLPVERDHIDVHRARTEASAHLGHLVEVILINVTRRSRIALDATHGFRSGHGQNYSAAFAGKSTEPAVREKILTGRICSILELEELDVVPE